MKPKIYILIALCTLNTINSQIKFEEKAIELGATVLTLSDSGGYILDPAGIDEADRVRQRTVQLCLGRDRDPVPCGGRALQRKDRLQAGSCALQGRGSGHQRCRCRPHSGLHEQHPEDPAAR